jgi:hypothetical protein
MREAVQSVSVSENGLALHLINDLAHLLGGIFLMVKKGDELRNGSLKVDIVLAKSVIQINEERLRAVELRVGI